jgi:hypothetical protein
MLTAIALLYSCYCCYLQLELLRPPELLRVDYFIQMHLHGDHFARDGGGDTINQDRSVVGEVVLVVRFDWTATINFARQ